MSDSSRKQTKRTQDSRSPSASYQALGLRKNPFSGQILPSDRPSVPPYEPVKQRIESFINNFLENRQSRGMVIIGDYGTGKTYHLKWMKNGFDEHGDLNVHTIYLETPGLEPYDLVRGILSEIGEEQIAKGVWNLVQPEIVREIKTKGVADYLKQFVPDVRVKARSAHTYNPQQMRFADEYYGAISDQDLLDHRDFLKAFDKTGHLSREKLRDYYKQKLVGSETLSITKNIAVAGELATICFYSGAPALSSWEKLVIPGSGGSQVFPSQGEPSFLQAIVRVLVKSGVEYLVLFLDEVEKVPLLETMTEREANRYLDTFRMLIDKSWHDLPFAWVLGSNEDAWELTKARNRALTERMVVELPLPRANDPKLARHVIQGFLNESRIESLGEGMGELHPFPENLLDLIPLSLRRTPRALVRICDLILEAASEKPRPKAPIAEDIIREVVERHTLEDEEK